MRSLAVATLFGLLLTPSFFSEAKAGTVIDLTQGQWDITGFDISSWDGSELFFETQTPNGSDFDISGYFNWYSNDIYRGSELFSGTYTADGFLEFSGSELVDPNFIQLSNYQAEVLSPSEIANGTWGAAGISGTWSATNSAAPEPTAVPEPGFVLSLGVMALAVAGLPRFAQHSCVRS